VSRVEQHPFHQHPPRPLWALCADPDQDSGVSARVRS
jgi:hypothetical protein